MSDGAVPTEGERRAIAGLEASGIPFEVTRHGPVGSLAEAAEARGIEPAGIVKTIVVRRGDDDFLFVLVPGDRRLRRTSPSGGRGSRPGRGLAPPSTVART